MATILDAERGGQGYVMALDAGTSSVRAVLFDEYGCKVAQASRPLALSYPHAGWVEQDPVEILSRQIACMIEVQFTSGIHSNRIASVGITNQRETVVVWDKATGQPIHPAIVWQCRRTADVVEKLEADGYADLIRERTGLIPDPYFSATKIAWILDNVEGAREMAERGRLLCGTIDCWLVYNLTHGQVHATDYTNASRTMLFDINKLAWDPELCDILRVPMSMLPEARPSSGSFGRVSSDIMTNHPPIAGVAGDQQASLFGHCCFAPGSVKNTYGTGCFMLMNVGTEPLLSSHGLLTTIGIAEGGKVEYALEGSVFQAGSVIAWLRDKLGIISNVEESAVIAQSCTSTHGCYFIPAFTGIGAPWWDANARGMIAGMSGGTDRRHIVRAACESMAYQTADVLRAMEADSGLSLTKLEVDGGASANEFIMQFQSDILGIEVVRQEVKEMTALGAAYLAGLATGYWSSRSELAANAAVDRRYHPHMDETERSKLVDGWHEALKRALD
jgi:glycerol kinase